MIFEGDGRRGTEGRHPNDNHRSTELRLSPKHGHNVPMILQCVQEKSSRGLMIMLRRHVQNSVEFYMWPGVDYGSVQLYRRSGTGPYIVFYCHDCVNCQLQDSQLQPSHQPQLAVKDAHVHGQNDGVEQLSPRGFRIAGRRWWPFIA